LVRRRRWRWRGGRGGWYDSGGSFVIFYIVLVLVLVVIGDGVLGVERIAGGVEVGEGPQATHLHVLRTRDAWELGGERGLCEDQSPFLLPVEADLGMVPGRRPAGDTPEPGTHLTLVLPGDTDSLPEGKLSGQGGDGGAVDVPGGA
jgi:hypothetical protein